MARASGRPGVAELEEQRSTRLLALAREVVFEVIIRVAREQHGLRVQLVRVQKLRRERRRARIREQPIGVELDVALDVLVLQREAPARRKTSTRAGDRKRIRHPKQQRKAATSRR